MAASTVGLRAGGAFLACVVFAEPISARDPEALDLPFRYDITETASVLYSVDNRNTRDASVERLADDAWGAWYNRIDLQLNRDGLEVGLRLDSAVFYTSQDPTSIALELTERRRGGPLGPPYPASEIEFFKAKLFEAGEELSTRYMNWVYPAKYYVGYRTADVEVTLGDVYAQYGRGFVLSLRKLDEIASDTTLRGARVGGRIAVDDVRLKLSAVGGVANPLRLDDASGRYLSVDASGREGLNALSEAGMPRAVDTVFVPRATGSYAPDRLAAAQFEGGTAELKLGLQGSLLKRLPALTRDIVRSADMARTGSVSLELPNLGAAGNAYLEFAAQDLEHGESNGPDVRGRALYLAYGLVREPFVFTLEARDYDAFYPLGANIDLGQAPEFSLVQYTSPPTTEALSVDSAFERFNTCVQGGRGKLDARVGEEETVFAWVGRATSWAESVTNESCERVDANANRVWDLASGFEIGSKHSMSRTKLTIGVRADDTERVLTNAQSHQTRQFYRESYVRYDVVTRLFGDASLELEGWHRRRLQTLGGPAGSFYQGEHVTAVTLGRLTLASGVEFDTDPLTPDLYFNGQVRYRLDSSSSVSAFGGQRRGGLRCVGGICRVLPPFEGGRVDVTLRF